MPVPKRKTSKSRRDKRSSNKGIKVKAITSCSNCNEALAPHQACFACGFYKGQKILTTKSDRALRRGKKLEEKQGQNISESGPTEEEK